MKIGTLVLTSALVMIVSVSFAQTKDFSGPYPKAPDSKINTETHTQQTVQRRKGLFSHHTKAFKYRRPKVTHSAQYEFYKRVEMAAREKQKMLKELAKPQYSNFLYYGHKHKPKKHRPDKMRYCKECGIRH